ncbi:hypothetical protein TWF751_005347 [Orbilia oligospora]|nr:hypothetical protein TWF751_005347 [Orbilia oligospora]
MPSSFAGGNFVSVFGCPAELFSLSSVGYRPSRSKNLTPVQLHLPRPLHASSRLHLSSQLFTRVCWSFVQK